MKFVQILIGLLLVSGASAAGYKRIGRPGQEPSGTNRGAALESGGTLPKDVSPDSRNRLPLIRREDLDDRGKKAYDAAVGGSNSGSGVPDPTSIPTSRSSSSSTMRTLPHALTQIAVTVRHQRDGNGRRTRRLAPHPTSQGRLADR